MQRITVTLDDALAADIDQLVVDRGYQGRSEAIRDLARSGLQQLAHEGSQPGDCVAALVYVYDHASRDLTSRLAHIFHQHHDLTISALHVHLDHDWCLEVSILRGPKSLVSQLGEQVTTERGVRYGRLVTAPADLVTERHAHRPGAAHSHQHAHIR